MHLKQIMKRVVALVLALSLLMSLSACSTTEILNAVASMAGISMEITPGQRLKNSTWINSDLEGSIDETTELNLKDDFHTTVNQDWLLKTDAVGDERIDSFTDTMDALDVNRIRLLTPGTEFDSDPEVMSRETLDHLHDLLWDMMDLAGNQEKRNELGVEPLRPYLEAIEQIDSLEDMTEYLKNNNGKNFTTENFCNFGINHPNNTRDYYTVYITYPMHKLLTDFNSYTSMGHSMYAMLRSKRAAVEYVLNEFGYAPKQIDKLFRNCYRFESRIAYLAPHNHERQDLRYLDRSNKIYTLEDIEKIQGKFPLTALLENAGVAHSETFRILEPGLLNFLGSYYKARNLEKLKAYFTVHTILEALPYLDEICQEMHQDIQNLTPKTEDVFPEPASEPDTSDPESTEKAQLDDLYTNYIDPLLPVPFELAYIGSYCSSAARQEILNMLEDIRAYYIEMLNDTEWMSPETREKAIEKVEKMKFRVLYPDVMPDYSGLIYQGYDEGGNLLDAIAAIQKANDTPDTTKVNQPIDRTDWNLKSMPTTTLNAAYQSDINSIVIFHGIMADGFAYDENASIEQNYGRLGVILGHEFTHAFDTSGYTRDAEGLLYGWWTNEDEVAFRLRSDKLVSYYTGLHIYPGMDSTYDGALVQTEAISDMGGMKCMLGLAEKIPDFDYDLFFRSYAHTWRCQTSLIKEMEMSKNVHPLNFLRTNVTLQQFDKFFETYDIGPGDGMYLAPEDRILVW